MDIAWRANNGRDVRMFGGTLTNHVILFGRKKVGRVDLWVEGQGEQKVEQWVDKRW